MFSQKSCQKTVRIGKTQKRCLNFEARSVLHAFGTLERIVETSKSLGCALCAVALRVFTKSFGNDSTVWDPHTAPREFLVVSQTPAACDIGAAAAESQAVTACDIFRNLARNCLRRTVRLELLELQSSKQRLLSIVFNNKCQKIGNDDISTSSTPTVGRQPRASVCRRSAKEPDSRRTKARN